MDLKNLQEALLADSMPSIECPGPSRTSIALEPSPDFAISASEPKKPGIVTGHSILLNNPMSSSNGTNDHIVMTDADRKAYTHILHLDTNPAIVVKQVANGTSKQHTQYYEATIQQW
jgi:hypothetical protein